MKQLKPVSQVCIIDDDENYVFALQRMLSIHRISEAVLAFPDGKEALDYLQLVKDYPAQLPDVIFLDIEMPGMNGWQFLESFSNLRVQLSKKMSIYMQSSSINIADIQRAKSYSIVKDYLIKPATKTDLLRVLEEVKNFQEKVK